MKIAATLFALVATQAPPESKTCPDCLFKIFKNSNIAVFHII